MAHFLKKSDGVAPLAIIDPRIVASSGRQSIRQVESLPSFHHEESEIPFRAVQSGVAGYRADERVSTLITHVMWLMELLVAGAYPIAILVFLASGERCAVQATIPQRELPPHSMPFCNTLPTVFGEAHPFSAVLPLAKMTRDRQVKRLPCPGRLDYGLRPKRSCPSLKNNPSSNTFEADLVQPPRYSLMVRSVRRAHMGRINNMDTDRRSS